MTTVPIVKLGAGGDSTRPGKRAFEMRRWLALASGVLAAWGMGCGSDGSPSSSGALPLPSSQVVTPTARERVTLAGNVHPAARAEFDLGPLEDHFPLEHLQLVLQRTPDKESTLETYIDGLHEPTSAVYHQWLTAEQLGMEYGPSREDLDAVKSWLESYGMRIDSVPPSHMFVEFSATAEEVEEAFGTRLHRLNVRGVPHIANMTDPRIPASLAGVVVGVQALHDFMPHPLHRDRGVARRDRRTGTWSLANPGPDLTIVSSGNTFYAVTPGDFATIYNLNPLLSAGFTGAGQTIAVIEDTSIENASDVATFRSAFGLSGYGGTFTQVTPAGSTSCTNAGVTPDETEAALDAEWAGATAPGAAIELASCANNTVAFGGLIAIENLVNSATPPPIISNSYGACESENGAAANQSFVNIYQQATAEGVSILVAAGDAGAAFCDDGLAEATHGIAVNGFASTPYNVAVGGTDFMDLYDSLNSGPPVTSYWNATNSASFASALSYVPEIPWNDSCASSLLYSVEGFTQGYGATGFCNSKTGNADFLTTSAASGGPSSFSTQPTWQTGVIGLPTKSGGTRYLPDVSFFAGNGAWNHFLLFCLTDTAQGGGPCTYGDATDALALAGGGTSFAAPSMAGIQALINQYTGSAQGNPNETLYKLAAAEYGARGSTRCNSSAGTPTEPIPPDSTCIFYDVTQGDMDVPCTGTTNCFGSGVTRGSPIPGVLSTSSTTLGAAYPAGTGWDYATGLGSINVYNLVTQF